MLKKYFKNKFKENPIIEKIEITGIKKTSFTEILYDQIS